MTDIIHGSPRAVPVDNPFFRWWQSVDQWTLVATLGLIVTGLLLSMAASVPLADSNDLPVFYYVYRQAIYGIISFLLINLVPDISISFTIVKIGLNKPYIGIDIIIKIA